MKGSRGVGMLTWLYERIEEVRLGNREGEIRKRLWEELMTVKMKRRMKKRRK